MVVFHHAAFTTAFELRGVRVPFTRHTVMIGYYFARMDAGALTLLTAAGWSVYRVVDGSVRFMCSWATTPEAVDELGEVLHRLPPARRTP